MRQAIRSFVLRQGRVSNAQRRACETLLPLHGIPFAENLLDLNQVFGRQAPKILEIGFGMGDSTAACRFTHGELPPSRSSDQKGSSPSLKARRTSTSQE